MKYRQHTVKKESAPPRRSAEGDAFSGLVIRVLRLSGLLTAIGDSIAKPAGQTSARWQVLAAADHAPSTVAQIARSLGLARQSIQRIADVLAAEGLALYTDNPEHARAKLFVLTPRGRAALATIQEAQRVWADDLGAELGAAPLRRTSDMLDRVMEALARRQPAGE